MQPLLCFTFTVLTVRYIMSKKKMYLIAFSFSFLESVHCSCIYNTTLSDFFLRVFWKDLGFSFADGVASAIKSWYWFYSMLWMEFIAIKLPS